jgi:hypothetical protein
MTHDEHKKLDEIYTLLVGFNGQPETGFIGQTNTRLKIHGERIGALEKWRWLVVGGAFVIASAIGFAARLITK